MDMKESVKKVRNYDHNELEESDNFGRKIRFKKDWGHILGKIFLGLPIVPFF